MFLFDLKSGYHHIDILEPHRQYFGFSWELHGVKQFYFFKVFPFGLSTACYAFTKLLRPLVKYWRARALLHLDDGIVAVEGETEALKASRRVRGKGWIGGTYCKMFLDPFSVGQETRFQPQPRPRCHFSARGQNISS